MHASKKSTPRKARARGKAAARRPLSAPVEPSLLSHFANAEPPQIAEPWRHDPLIANKIFFALPSELWRLILHELKPNTISQKARNLEQAATAFCEHYPGTTGIWCGTPIRFDLLPLTRPQFPPAAEIEEAIPKEFGGPGVGKAYAAAVERRERDCSVARAYAGWLLTNSDFLAEHDQLCTCWKAELRQARCMPSFPLVDFDVWQNPTHYPTGRQVPPGFFDEYQQFYRRWRLASMPAPLLPRPLMPELPVYSARRLVDWRQRAGHAIFILDIWPLPTRDELQKRLEEAIRRAGNQDHLTAWIAIVGSQNGAKNVLARYERLCQLTHYWRALHSRHAQVLGRCTSRLLDAFSQYLRVDVKSLSRDLSLIKGRLGPDWANSRHSGL